MGQPWKGKKGITETVAQIMKRRANIPTRVTEMKDFETENLLRTNLPQNPLSPPVASWPPRAPGGGPLMHGGGDPLFSTGSNWTGSGLSESGVIPPDSEGAVGPTQVLYCVNYRIKVFDKAGNLGALNTSTNTFFSSVRGSSGTSDPRVRFDRLSQRFFIVMINTSSPNRVLIAVSSGPTITDQTSFTFYQFQQDQVTPTNPTDTGGLFDYPSLGVDANALYIGGNIFNPSLVGSTAFVVRKSDLLAGTLVVSAFRQIGNGSGTGVYTPQGVDNDDPNPTYGYFIGSDWVAWGDLVYRRISNAGGTPSISGNIVLTVPNTYMPGSTFVPALGSTSPLESLDDRLMGAMLRLNRLTGQRTLWTAHNEYVTSSGVSSNAGTRFGVRWYQVGSLDTTPVLLQSGTLFDPSANTESRWMGSIAMNGQGHALVSSTASGPSRHAEVTAAYRFSGDALGTTQPEQNLVTSSFAYNVQSGQYQRWGDYSHTVIDPADDMTMWTFQEFCNAANSWGVRVTQVLAPPPASIASLSQTTIAQGATANITITGTSSSGSGFFDPGAGFPNRLGASFSGTGVTVNSVTFTDPTHMTVNVTAAGGAALGARTLTVTNPDGQTSTLASALAVVAGSADVTPSAIFTDVGVLPNGGTSTVSASDDVWFRVFHDPTIARNTPNVQVRFTATAPAGSFSQLTLTFEAHQTLGPSANVTQKIDLYNFTTGLWDEVDSRQGSATDSTATISAAFANYMDPSSREMRVRLRLLCNVGIDTRTAAAFVDFVNWHLAP